MVSTAQYLLMELQVSKLRERGELQVSKLNVRRRERERERHLQKKYFFHLNSIHSPLPVCILMAGSFTLESKYCKA